MHSHPKTGCEITWFPSFWDTLKWWWKSKISFAIELFVHFRKPNFLWWISERKAEFIRNFAPWKSFREAWANISLYFLCKLITLDIFTILFQYCLSGDPNRPCFVLKFKHTTIMLDCGLDVTTLTNFLPLTVTNRLEIIRVIFSIS